MSRPLALLPVWPGKCDLEADEQRPQGELEERVRPRLVAVVAEERAGPLGVLPHRPRPGRGTAESDPYSHAPGPCCSVRAAALHTRLPCPSPGRHARRAGPRAPALRGREQGRRIDVKASPGDGVRVGGDPSGKRGGWGGKPVLGRPSRGASPCR